MPEAMPVDSLRYAGFWPRLGSSLLDRAIVLSLSGLVLWGEMNYRLFDVYYLFPEVLFGLFYSIYLVKRFGGTPGKLIMGIRIRKLDGGPVGYREAFIRNLPEFVFSVAIPVAFIGPLLHMSDAEYLSLSFLSRYQRLAALAPSWYNTAWIAQNIWFWGELIVLLTNRKRRALHDFIAGTVVVHNRSAPISRAVVTDAVVTDVVGSS
jgi:uncharacterized RDD family membrane protein YckC